MDILKVIDEYNLSIRKIPSVVRHTWTYRDNEQIRPGGQIITIKGKKFHRYYEIPNNAGKYMCKPVNDTSSMVRWNTKTDNLADTLEESIKLFLLK